jgi:hypothetical protein
VHARTGPSARTPLPAGAGDREQMGAGPYDRRVGLEGPRAGHRVDEERIRAPGVGRVQSRPQRALDPEQLRLRQPGGPEVIGESPGEWKYAVVKPLCTSFCPVM